MVTAARKFVRLCSVASIRSRNSSISLCALLSGPSTMGTRLKNERSPCASSAGEIGFPSCPKRSGTLGVAFSGGKRIPRKASNSFRVFLQRCSKSCSDSNLLGLSQSILSIAERSWVKYRSRPQPIRRERKRRARSNVERPS